MTATPVLKKLLPELVKATKAAWERRAAEVLDVGKIRLAMHQAATEGHNALRISMPAGLEVQGTEAAERFLEWAKVEGLTVTWHDRTATLPDGRFVTVTEPEITWLSRGVRG